MFTTLITQPIFNLLVLIYGILPGHNFGLSIILFTIVIRLLLYPLLKKQLHQVKVMRKLQPEMKRIKAEAKGDKRREQLMTMELYKERGVNPFSSLGMTLLQVPVLIGLYSGLRRILNDPKQIESFAYPALQHLPWMKQLATNIHQFDATLFHAIDLTRSALGPKGMYLPAMVIVVASAVVQFYQSKQLMPAPKDAKSLREILKGAGEGQQADQAEVNAAVGRSTRFLLPVMIFLFTVNLPSALALYWLTGGVVALIQQTLLLREDTQELEAEVDKPSKDVSNIAEGEVVAAPKPKKAKKKSGGKGSNRRKR